MVILLIPKMVNGGQLHDTKIELNKKLRTLKPNLIIILMMLRLSLPIKAFFALMLIITMKNEQARL